MRAVVRCAAGTRSDHRRSDVSLDSDAATAEADVARWYEAKEAGNAALQKISEEHKAMMVQIREQSQV
jgi:hypothetical protein